MTEAPDTDTRTASDRLEDKLDWLIEAEAETRRELGRVRYYLLALACVSIGLAIWVVMMNMRAQTDIAGRIEQTGQETADTVLRNLPVPEGPSVVTRSMPPPLMQTLPDTPPQPAPVPVVPRPPGFQPFDLRASPGSRQGQ